jgi:hypothetical protein
MVTDKRGLYMLLLTWHRLQVWGSRAGQVPGWLMMGLHLVPTGKGPEVQIDREDKIEFAS